MLVWFTMNAPAGCSARGLCSRAWGRTRHEWVFLTEFDFGILCEQNILSLNVSVNHMMGVKMGKTLEDKDAHNEHTQTHSQMTTVTMSVKPQTLASKSSFIVGLLWLNDWYRAEFPSGLLLLFFSKHSSFKWPRSRSTTRRHSFSARAPLCVCAPFSSKEVK